MEKRVAADELDERAATVYQSKYHKAQKIGYKPFMFAN